MIKQYEYTGYLRSWVPVIIEEHRKGTNPGEIASLITPEVKKRYKDHPWYGHVDRNSVLPMVKYIIHRSGFNHPIEYIHSTTERQERIWERHQQGLAPREIALEIGLSTSRIKAIIKITERLHALQKRIKRREELLEIFTERWRLETLKKRMRPLDMGGPRDVWIEKGPWDEL